MDDQEEASLQELLREYGRLTVLSYSADLSDNTAVKNAVVRELRGLLRDNSRVTIVGASKGAMIAHDAMAQFHRDDRARIKLVFVDPPSGSKSLGLGGNIGAPIARWLRAILPIGHGMALRWLSAPSGPPNANETQANLDFPAVARTAEQRLKAFPFPVWWGDLGWMDLFHVKPENLAGFSSVHYIQCTLGNVTVNQPLGVDPYKAACPELQVHPAAMPHCGWLQQPAEAERAFRAALDTPWN